VIGTRLGGTPEAILDQKTGFLVNPFDVDDVAAKALILIRDAELRQQLGMQGRLRVAAVYTVEQMAARYEAIYQCR
jgi:L-malate glycosyltransferase